jgi:phenylacetate-CoA ligase
MAGHVLVVTTGAESLHEHQINLIERAFGAKVRQHYGMAEAVANISERPNGMLVVDEDFSYVEFEPGDSDSSNRIIGTNWSNPAFPLIRYDTGDRAALSEIRHEGWRVVQSLEGRDEDYIALPDGRKIGRLDHIFKDFVEIREAQIYQPDENAVVLRVVPADTYTETTEAKLIRETRDRLGDSIAISVEQHEAIERSASGKIKFVVSRVK